MIHVCFLHAESLLDGIALLADDLGFALTDADRADLLITAQETSDNLLSVTREGRSAHIVYGGGKSRFWRGLAILSGWYKEGKNTGSRQETPLFSANGAMVDMSRNAVMNLPTVQFFLRKMALMGLNTFMLYTEDTYEIENRPYFGYMRGRYTPDELRELDAYALALGIELIPCVQMLGHLATMLRWSAAAPYKDTANALLVGAEETYRLIEDMLTTLEGCFTSRRIHIGMDETHDLGTGRYLDTFGYTPRREIYLTHLHRVVQLVHDHGFTPMMWSDMFFRLAGEKLAGYRDYDPRVVFPDDLLREVPEGIQQVFWDYYQPDQEFYAHNIRQHALLGKNTLFAGGIWTWSGHCPHYSRSLRNTLPALEACRKTGVKEIIATIWHNGAECSLLLALAGLAWYADFDYTGHYDEDSVRDCFARSCGLSYDDFLAAELPEYPHGGNVGCSRALLYNDPLTGLIDAHITGMEPAPYYRQTAARLESVSADDTPFASAFAVLTALCRLLENKADFGVRLKAAYDRGDRSAMEALAEECALLTEKLNALRTAHRKAWMEHNKPFGWEVHDIRYGGLLARFDTARERINAYLSGEIERIEELEAVRKRFDCRAGGEPFGGEFVWYQYSSIATVSKL